MGIGALCQTQSTLTKLDLSTCVRVTDMALNHIALGLPKLVSLSLFNCRAVTDTGISYLSQLAHLQQFNGQGLEHMTSNGEMKEVIRFLTKAFFFNQYVII